MKPVLSVICILLFFPLGLYASKNPRDLIQGTMDHLRGTSDWFSSAI
jgi:hypothetical protein